MPEDPYAAIAQPAQSADPYAAIALAQRGPSAEEQQFLQENPNYKYFASDPKFPNRPEGIYPTGPGNEWRSKPDYAQAPVDLHLLRHNYQGAKAGLMAATAPLALEATVPQLVGGVVGGGVGTVGGQEAAKAAGAGEAGQEVAGDVGSLVGGGLGSGLGGWAAGKARALYSALPDAVQKELLGVVSPRLRHAISFWDALNTPEGAKAAAKLNPELDATGENKPFAGGMDEYTPPRSKELDATGENRPFAGGMDEAPAPRSARTSTSQPRTVVIDPVSGAPEFSDVVASRAASAAQPTSAAKQAVESVVAPPAKATATSSDPLAARLRFHMEQVEQQHNEATPDVDEDLTNKILDSLAIVHAAKAAGRKPTFQ